MRTATCLLAAAVVALAASACSTDAAVQSLVENAIEGETGEDINLEFDSGDGSFSIDTRKGSISVDEDGNFVITDENGEVITGNASASVGGIDISTDDGSFSMEADEAGNVTMETEDETFSVGAITEVPDVWPSDVPKPSGIAIDRGRVFTNGQNVNVSVTGTTGDGAGWADSYGAVLVGAGFVEQTTISSRDSVLIRFTRGFQEVVNIQALDNDEGSWSVSASYLINNNG